MNKNNCRKTRQESENYLLDTDCKFGNAKSLRVIVPKTLTNLNLEVGILTSPKREREKNTS
jgi:hypothetical protein